MEEREESTNIRQTLPEENEAIYGILMKIIKSWQPETEEKKVDLDEAETVTISLKDLKKEGHSVMKELGETVILSRKDFNKGPLPEKKELNETVILSPEGLNKDPVPEKVEKPQEPLSETVIISPQRADDETLTFSPQTLSKDTGDKDNFGCSEKDVKEPEGPDFLTETVILKPGKARDKERDGNTA